MQEHTIPVGYLVFPVLLPFAQCVFFKELVCGNDEHRGGCLEAYTAFNAYDGVTHVHIAAYAVCCTNLLNLLNSFYGVLYALAVHSLQLPLFECEVKLLLTALFNLFQVCTLGQALLRIEYLATADACAPYTHVV